MTVRTMSGVRVKKNARAGCVVVALRGELDLCTAAPVVRALTTLAAAGARIIVDLAELAFMDCYSLSEITAVQAQARRSGGDLVLASPQPVVLRLLVLCGMVSRRLVFASVDEAVSGAGHAPAALGMSGAAGDATASTARFGSCVSAVQGRGSDELRQQASRTLHRGMRGMRDMVTRVSGASRGAVSAPSRPLGEHVPQAAGADGLGRAGVALTVPSVPRAGLWIDVPRQDMTHVIESQEWRVGAHEVPGPFSRLTPAEWKHEHAHGLWIIDQLADQVSLDRAPAGITVTVTFTISSSS
jgi:anti-sigma B factor antagonist